MTLSKRFSSSSLCMNTSSSRAVRSFLVALCIYSSSVATSLSIVYYDDETAKRKRAN